jgi:hypothetical protein
MKKGSAARDYRAPIATKLSYAPVWAANSSSSSPVFPSISHPIPNPPKMFRKPSPKNVASIMSPVRWRNKCKPKPTLKTLAAKLSCRERRGSRKAESPRADTRPTMSERQPRKKKSEYKGSMDWERWLRLVELWKRKHPSWENSTRWKWSMISSKRRMIVLLN